MILFDLGGVLVDASFDDLAATLSLPFAPEQMRDKWLASAAIRDFETGVIGPTEFSSRFVGEWGLRMTPESFEAAFTEWPRGPFPEAGPLVARVRESHQVGCFSNCNELHWRRFGPFLDWFDVSVSSHLIGSAKPAVEAFEAALIQAGASPDETWFFDDSPCNVDSARSLGLRAFVVRGVGELESELVLQGLLRQA